MRIAKSDIDWYRESMRAVGNAAAARVSDALSGSMTTRNAAREAAIEAITDAIGVEGEQAQALAAQLFDEICAAEGIDADEAVLFDDLIDPAMLARKVYYFSRQLVEEGGHGGFASDCAALADYYAKRCGYEGMVRNCHANGVRYARVPTGADTCDFCLMLASRGFVYYSDVSASEGSHRNCDCVCVPGGPSTTVEGYDPDLYYDLWQGRIDATAHERSARRGTTYQVERMRIMEGYKRSAKAARARRRLR